MASKLNPGGVSVGLFCAAIKALSKVHGPKMAAGPLQEFRAALAEAEFFYQQMPDAPKKSSKPHPKN